MTTARSPSSVSPKQPPSLTERDWYPYYAGYTESFVEAVIQTHLHTADFVLDPWSGSGTTGIGCLTHGLWSVGIDINPAMTVIARARLTPVSSSKSFSDTTAHILSVAIGVSAQPRADDPLATWVRRTALSSIRAIQIAIHQSFLTPRQQPSKRTIVNCPEALPVEVCFYYSALFLVVRDLLAPFRTSNPMWLKTPHTTHRSIAPSWDAISTRFRAATKYLESRLRLRPPTPRFKTAPFHTGTATRLPYPDSHFDAVLTSPPYATRLDYVKGTLPELGVLGASDRFVARLRRQTTGTPVVAAVPSEDTDPLQTGYGNRLLDAIVSHSSKGSRSYYWPWMSNYLSHLQSGLVEIDRTVDPNGVICIVVQDSYYKEHRIDLQRLVTEILESRGRVLNYCYDYPVRTPRSPVTILDAGDKRPNRSNTESLLVFTVPQ